MKSFSSKLWFVLTVKCDDASRLTSESFERRLVLHERLAIRAHQMVCFSCRQFEQQLALIHRAIERVAQVELSTLDSGPQLDESAKERLRNLYSRKR